MHRFTRTLHGYWSSCAVFGLGITTLLIGMPACQNRAPSLRMLDVRADYDGVAEEQEVGLYQRGRFGDGTLARRSAPRVARVWIYPHELPSRDYFWGGYVSLIVTEDSWVFDGENTEEIPSKPAKGHR